MIEYIQHPNKRAASTGLVLISNVNQDIHRNNHSRLCARNIGSHFVIIYLSLRGRCVAACCVKMNLNIKILKNSIIKKGKILSQKKKKIGSSYKWISRKICTCLYMDLFRKIWQNRFFVTRFIRLAFIDVATYMDILKYIWIILSN